MFEAAEVGNKLEKEAYEKSLPELRSKLLDIQWKLKEAGVPVLVIVSGVEASGKGKFVNRLHEWMDARNIEASAFWDESDEEKERPYYWKFFRKLPPRGKMGVFFGSWYTSVIIDRVYKKTEVDEFNLQIQHIEDTENLLHSDGYLIIKLWFHLSGEDQKKALEKKKKEGVRLSPQEKKFIKKKNKFRRISEEVISKTNTRSNPWNIIEAGDQRYRETTAAKIIMKFAEMHLENHLRKETKKSSSVHMNVSGNQTVLDAVDLAKKLESDVYSYQLEEQQNRFSNAMWKLHKNKKSVMLLFEGWDAAGKGSSIRRVISEVDARLYRVIPFAAPTEEELSHHYLWRFWRHIPRAGYLTIYDRSWYGRVLVERVEGFAEEKEWRRAYHEINLFEKQLVDHGIILLKFWIHIDEDEQLRRFKEREIIPWKQFKITEEDWRNREKWSVYKDAVNDMVSMTGTPETRWNLIPGNDKKYARVKILKIINDAVKNEI